jgi:hypothetical protein
VAVHSVSHVQILAKPAHPLATHFFPVFIWFFSYSVYSLLEFWGLTRWLLGNSHDEGLIGLVESCMLALDIRYQTSGRQDLPRFGALVELIPLRHVCLILIMSEINYNGAVRGLRGGVLAERLGG